MQEHVSTRTVRSHNPLMVYDDRTQMRDKMPVPWHTPPAQPQLGMPLQYLPSNPSPTSYQSDFEPTRPLQVRSGTGGGRASDCARDFEDESLSVEQMSKNLLSQQQLAGSSVTRSADPHTGRAATSLHTEQMKMDELQRTVEMHAQVLADHRDAIRKNNKTSDEHEEVFLHHSAKIDRLKAQHTAHVDAQASLASEVSRIQSSFKKPAAKKLQIAENMESYTTFKELQARYKS